MSYKLTIGLGLIVMLGVISLALQPARASWWFSKTSTVNTPPTVQATANLDDQAKAVAEAKYKIWAASFEQAKVNLVMANQNNFRFSVPEINYIFATETVKAKNPIIKNFQLTVSQNNLNISGDFHKIINGHFTFIAQVIKDGKKAHLQVSYVRLYGFPLPSSWIADPLNQALDEYFNFLYQDSRYQDFNLIIQDNSLQFIPIFQTSDKKIDHK
jgi:hypothetical protein